MKRNITKTAIREDVAQINREIHSLERERAALEQLLGDGPVSRTSAGHSYSGRAPYTKLSAGDIKRAVVDILDTLPPDVDDRDGAVATTELTAKISRDLGGVSRSTVLRQLHELERSGRVERHGKTRWSKRSTTPEQVNGSARRVIANASGLEIR